MNGMAIDVEAMLRACVPGGSICDPQKVADSIREYYATVPTQHPVDALTDEEIFAGWEAAARCASELSNTPADCVSAFRAAAKGVDRE